MRILVTGGAGFIGSHTGPRRAGDPISLVASNLRARAELGWQPRYPELGDMVAHAWAFMNR